MNNIDLSKYLHEKYNPNEEYLGRDKEINRITPLVSICTTTYQHAEFIVECIEGILNQKTDFTFELIIGEDESTDGTREICKKYANKYPDLIRLFLRDRNTSCIFDEFGERVYGFNGKWTTRSARGKYIALCEGDDYWSDPLKLQKQIDLLKKYGNSCVMSFHPVTIQDCEELKNNIIASNLGNKERVITSSQIISNYIPTVSAVIREDVFRNYPEMSNSVPFGDAFLWSVAASKGHAIYIPEAMAVRRKHNKGVYSSLSTKNQLEKSIKTRELMLRSDELSSVHIYIKAHLITLYQKYLWVQRGLMKKYQIVKKINLMIFISPSVLIWYLKILVRKQVERVKRYTLKYTKLKSL